MTKTIRVDGLVLHRWSSMDHAAPFAQMMLDDPFSADLAMVDPEGIVGICMAMDRSWREHGWGPYAIFSDGKFGGVIGPHPAPGIDDPVWSAHLRTEWRGQRVTTTLGPVIRELLGLPRIVSFTKIGNLPARRALSRHFTFEGIREFKGEPVAWYTWEKPGST